MTRRRRPAALVGNAADAAQVGWAERWKENERETLLACLKDVMSTGAGRLVIAELVALAGVNSSVYVEHANSLYFNEGRRNLGLEVLALVEEASPNDLDLMEQEARARRRGVEDEALALQEDGDQHVEH